MAEKFACMQCGFVFDDPDMEMCPRCGTELGKEWNPDDLVDVLVTDIAGADVPALIRTISEISGYPTQKIGPMLQKLPATVYSGATPMQAEYYLEKLRAANAAAIAENAHDKSARLAAEANAAEAAAVERQAKLDAEKELKAKQAEAEARVKAETEAAKAQAEAEARAKAEAEAVKAQAEAEARKAEAEARAQAEAKQKAEAEAKTAAEKAKLEAEARAKAEAEAAKAKAEAEAKKAEAESKIAAEKAKVDAEAMTKAEVEKKRMELEAEEQAKRKAADGKRNRLLIVCAGIILLVACIVGCFIHISAQKAKAEAEERARQELVKRKAEEKASSLADLQVMLRNDPFLTFENYRKANPEKLTLAEFDAVFQQPAFVKAREEIVLKRKEAARLESERKAKAEAEAREKARIAAERKAKADAEAREKARIAAERKAKEEAEARAKADKEETEYFRKAFQDCMQRRDAWIAKAGSEVKEAFEYMKNADLKYPTVKDATMAARCADVKSISIIYNNGFTDWKNPDIMLAACQTPFLVNVQTIHKLGGDVNAKDKGGMTALMYAAEEANNVETVKYLVSQGAQVNAKNNNDWTALMSAAGTSNNVETVKYLVSQGADINVKTSWGGTVLMSAAGTSNNVETVKYLVSQGAKINEKTDNGCTALMSAAEHDVEMVKYLVSQGAKINEKTDNGWTALMSAARRSNNVETVKYLVSQGADVNAKDKDGKTALDYAEREKHKDICDYLRSKGGYNAGGF